MISLRHQRGGVAHRPDPEHSWWHLHSGHRREAGRWGKGRSERRGLLRCRPSPGERAQQQPGEPWPLARYLNVGGDYTQTTAGVLNIEIEGYVPGASHDQLNVSGQAALAGTLDVRLVNGFRPRPCDRFPIVTYGSRTGALGALNGMDLGGGLFLRPVYGATDLALVAFSSASTINLSPASLAMDEGGPPGTTQVCLASRPTSGTGSSSGRRC